MFQVFQLMTLVVHCPVSGGENIIVSLDRVAIKKQEVRGVLLCVQNVARSPQITQTNFFSESGSTMLSESVAIANSITSNPVYAPRSILESACVSRVITDLHACWDRALCAVALPKTPLSAAIYVATLGTRRHQDLGCGFQMSWKKGALNMCQLFRLLLVLLDQAEFVLPPASA